MNMNLRLDVKNYIEENRLICSGEHVLVGLSCGSDSICLLHILNSLKEEMGFSLSALYVHHGLRGEAADEEIQFGEKLCEKMEIPFYVRYIDTRKRAQEAKESLEEAGRNLRYQAFEEVQKETNSQKVAVAHHKQDQAETILFNMIRGSRLNGLSGMPNKRGCYIRPLMAVDKKQILEYLQENQLEYKTDASNQENQYSRNKIRLEVLPALSEIREDAVDKIVETGTYLEEIRDYLKEEAEERIRQYGELTQDGLFLKSEAFQGMKRVPAEMMIYQALKQIGTPMKDKGKVLIAQILDLVNKPVGKQVLLSKGGSIYRNYEGLEFSRKEKTEYNRIQKYTILTREFPYVPSMEITRKEYTKWFDCDKIKEAVCLRTRRPGDRFSTRIGTEKKLKDFFIDEKIPVKERDFLPVVASGNEVLWVVGVRMSEKFKVTEQTTKILEIEIKGQE